MNRTLRSHILYPAVFAASAFLFSCSGDDNGDDTTLSSSSVEETLSSSSEEHSISSSVAASSSSVAPSSSSVAASSSSETPSSSSTTPSSSSADDGNSGTFTDSRDDKTYKWVKVGSQVWMAENLNFAAEGSVCYYNTESYCGTYGRLYNWHAAMSACPEGWHLPSDAEWEVLVKYADPNATGDWDNISARHLKAASGWTADGKNLDAYGFSALPGGSGSYNGYFGNEGNFGLWWSATNSNDLSAFYRIMYNDYEHVGRFNVDNRELLSVRCLRDLASI